jgi:hypothetical protein
MTISGVFYDSHPLTYQRQTFSPNGYLVKVFDITVPADAPDPATTHIISGSPSPPDGIQVGTGTSDFKSCFGRMLSPFDPIETVSLSCKIGSVIVENIPKSYCSTLVIGLQLPYSRPD